MQPAQTPSAQRIQSIDILRGLVMLIMALDHVRDLLHNGALTSDPLDLSTTTPILFFTRWITHFCAPVFVFLSGASAFLSSRNKSQKQTSLFLLKRGVWLILVEITVVTLGITFNPFFNTIVLQVIWVIGWSMIVLSLLLFTNIQIIAFIGFLLVAGHNVLDTIYFQQGSTSNVMMSILFTNQQRFVPLNETHVLFVLYAILPWTGIMLLGYVFGTLFKNGVTTGIFKKVFWIGFGVTLLFILLRFVNGYGEPLKWSKQKTFLFSVLSFINTSKYPPSLLYTCMTLGPAIMLLSGFEFVKSRFTNVLSLYGRVPFFYYILHFYLIHTLALILFFITDFGVKDIANPVIPFFFRPVQFGVDLF